MPCRQEVEEILVEIFVLMVFDFLDQYWQLFSLQGHIVNIIGLACSFTVAHLCPRNQKAARDSVQMNGHVFVPIKLFTK